MQTREPYRGLDNDPLWYKDAVIYEVHVRAFFDSNGDGMGDFRGITEKLDYLEDLGVTVIWLLPFCPSPWKDDGYDISDFRDVHPAYGTLRDFQTFLREAHRRGMRVITELVLNHTSDQHLWFQRSRRAAPGSRWRDFYVWSDTPDKYRGTRIIFKDFEPSNWTWDPIAKAYFWHRFYSHQPDLNYDSPLVQRAVKRVLDFWSELGVDGFRLDAIPYLYEREGTDCENLPETHAFLKELRRYLDSRFPNRVLLAEANMWPEDAIAYLSDADECHMSFHFPLMPRLFMALRLEDRFPIIDILRRTPAIPETCQWALFLRNHDELTLEMVTDEERDYMYRVYASDRQARINLGIRRRLAPLLGNDRPRIELMNAMLFSLPGTPVIYYGDEIGLGDNVYLGDRNGMRTPMQWNPDRNAGFSRANPQRLYLPVNIDPEYHYEALNVEAQQNNPNSLLNWMRRLIALRKQYKAFGRGTLEFLQPSNPRILAFYRRYGDELILVVANLSRYAQPVELDLTRFQGTTPVEMFGKAEFPRIEAGYYPITLGPNSFYWFSLEQRASTVQISGTPRRAEQTELPMLQVLSWHDVLQNSTRLALTKLLPSFLSSRTWFRGGGRQFRHTEIVECVPILEEIAFLLLVRVEYTQGDLQHYVLPVSVARKEEASSVKEKEPNLILAELKSSDGEIGVLYEAQWNSAFSLALLEMSARRRKFQGEEGVLLGKRNRQFRKIWGVSHPNLEPDIESTAESNTTVIYGKRFVLKLLRNVETGLNPGVEIGRVLTEEYSYAHAAPFAGSLEYLSEKSNEPVTIALLHGFVENEGEAWNLTRRHVADYFNHVKTQEKEAIGKLSEFLPPNIFALEVVKAEAPEIAQTFIGDYLRLAQLMGHRVAEMHGLLARVSADPNFTPEPYTDFYRQSLYHGFLVLTTRAFELIRQRFAELPDDVQVIASKALEGEEEVAARFRLLYDLRIDALRTRQHGRLHLGHLLYTGSDFTIFDFEGDTDHPLSDRRIKRSPLRDVASMLHSFGYAAQTALLRESTGAKNESVTRRSLRILVRFWYSHVSAAFLRGYWGESLHASYLPKTQRHQQVILDIYLLERALLDILANLGTRPHTAVVPLNFILHLLEKPEREQKGTD